MSKRNISYVKQEEPSFLKQFKDKIGYKEGPDVDTKRELPSRDDYSDGEEADDEQPQVVVLKKGDLTKEEAELVSLGQTVDLDLEENTGDVEDDADKPTSDGRIVFKKPNKRSQEESSDLSISSSSKKHKTKDVNKTADGAPKVKNTCLLSFDEEDEEDG